jgi:hypothetical protein
MALPIHRELEEVDVNIKALVAHPRRARPDGPAQARNVINVGLTGCSAGAHVDLRGDEGVQYFRKAYEEVKKQGVTVTRLCPEYVMTGFQQVAGTTATAAEPRPPDARAGGAALHAAAGHAIVIPGALNRTLATGVVRFTPRFAVRRTPAGSSRTRS